MISFNGIKQCCSNPRVVVSIFVLIVIFTTAYRLNFYELACSADEQGVKCFREWTSALGGWVALLAAIPTVYFLRRQVLDAQQQHIKTLRIECMPVLAIIKRARDDAFVVRTLAASIRKELLEGSLDELMETSIRHKIRDKLINPGNHFDDLNYETDFDPPQHFSLNNAREIIRFMGDGNYIPPDTKSANYQIIEMFAEGVIRYSDNIHSAFNR